MRHLVLGMAFLLTSVYSASAITYTWVGGTDSNWSNPLNWSPNTGVPTSVDDVIISNSGNPINFTSNVTIRNFTSTNKTINLLGFNLSINGLATISTGSILIGSGSITVDNASDVQGVFVANINSASIGQNLANPISLTIKSRDILIKNSTFYGGFQAAKTGTISSSWFGGNTFYGSFDIANSGGGILYLSANAVNSYLSTFSITNSNASFAYITYANGANKFVGDATFNNNSGTGQSTTISLGNYNGSLEFQNKVSFNNTGNNAISSNISIGSLATITFSGDVYFTNRGTGTTITTNIFNANPVYFGGNIAVQSTVNTNTVNNHLSSGVMFGNNTNNIISQASGKNLIVSGADGNTFFSGGVLNFNNFKEADNSGIQQIKMQGNTKFFSFYSRFNGQSDIDLDYGDFRYSSLGDVNSSQNFTLNSYNLTSCTFNGSNILLSNKITSPAFSPVAGHVFNGPTTVAGISGNRLTTGWMPNANSFYPSTRYNDDVTFLCEGNFVVDQNTPSVYNGKVKLLCNSGSLYFGSGYLIAPSTLTSSLEFNSIPLSTTVSLIQTDKATVFGDIISKNVNNATIIIYRLNQEGSTGSQNIITTTGSNIDVRFSKLIKNTIFNSVNRTVSISNTSLTSITDIVAGATYLTSNTMLSQTKITGSFQNLKTNSILGALDITVPANSDNTSSSWDGGNTISGVFTFNNYCPVKNINFASDGKIGNVFNNDFTWNNFSNNTNVGITFSLGVHPINSIFNGNITLNNDCGNIYIGANTGNLILANGKNINITNWNRGFLNIRYTTVLGTNLTNLSLPSSATLSIITSTFNNPVNITAGGISLQFNKFNNTIVLNRTNYAGNQSYGNIFSQQVDLNNLCVMPSNVYDAGWNFGSNNYPDIFLGKLIVKNVNDRAIVRLAYNSIGNKFMDDIYIYNNKAGAFVTFCDYTSTASLLGINKNIFLAKSNVSDLHLGTFSIANFYKESKETMNWGDPAQGRVLISNTLLNGDLNVKAAILGLNDGTFTGVVNFDVTGAGNTNFTCSKNTVFEQDVTFIANTTNQMAFGVTTNAAKTIFKGNATFIRKGAGWIYLVHNGSTEFYKNLTYISTSNTSFSVGISYGTTVVGVKFLGDVDQYIDFSYKPGTNATSRQFFGIPKMEVNKPSGRLFTNSTIGLVAGNLNLVNGNIVCQTGTAIGVYFEGNSTVIGGGGNSFIDGTIATSQSGPFTFHVGRGQNYMPLSVSAASGANSYISVSPIVATSTTLSVQGQLKDVIKNQYWQITNWVTPPVTPPTTLSLNWNTTNGLSINKNVMALAIQTGTSSWTSLPSNSFGDNSTGVVSNTINFPLNTTSTPKTVNVGLGYLTRLDIDTKTLSPYTYTLSGALESNLPPSYTSGINGTNNGIVTIHPDLNSAINMKFNKPTIQDSSFLRFNYIPAGVDTNSVQYLYKNTYTKLNNSYYTIENAGSKYRFTNIDPVPDEFNGLVAYYPFCGDPFDLGPYGNNGTINGVNISTDRFGNPYSSYSFNGIDQYITIGNQQSLKMTDGLTISVWIKPNNISAGLYNIISDHAPGEAIDGSGKILRLAGNEIQFIVYGIYGFGTAIYAKYNLSNNNYNTWHHVVGTYDRNKIKLYVDGVLVDQVINNFPIAVNNNPLLIGKSGYGEYFKGQIDELKIYNRAISYQEVFAQYKEPYVQKSGIVVRFAVSENESNYGCEGQVGFTHNVSRDFDRFNNPYGAYKFNGSNSFVDSYSLQSNVFNQNYTLSIWYKSKLGDTTTRDQSLLSFYDLNNAKVFDIAYNKPTSKLNFFDEANGLRPKSLNNVTFFNDWTHLAIVQNNGLFSYYINGNIQDEFPVINITNTGLNRLVMGGLPEGGQPLNGSIDDFILFDKALSIKQINQLFKGQLIGSSLSLYLDQSKKNVGYTITTNTGQLVYSGVVPGVETFLDLSFLPSGDYILKLADSTSDLRFLKK